MAMTPLEFQQKYRNYRTDSMVEAGREARRIKLTEGEAVAVELPPDGYYVILRSAAEIVVEMNRENGARLVGIEAAEPHKRR